MAGPLANLHTLISTSGATKWAGRRTNSPPRGVKVLAGRPDRQGDLLDLRRQRRDAGEGDVVQAVVDLVRQDDDLVLEAQVGNLLQLVAVKDLADGVVCCLLECSLGGQTATKTYAEC